MDSQSRELLHTALQAHEILYEANTIFPFTIFPDTVSVDREKVTVTNRYFFRVAKINSTQISDIQSIEANVGPIFGSLRITSRFFVTNPRVVKFLWREDATKIQSLVQGFIIASHKEIDHTKIDKGDLVTMLVNLGRGTDD